jgi:hypothetical protein
VVKSSGGKNAKSGTSSGSRRCLLLFGMQQRLTGSL